jgi:hypothetical protein
LKKSLPIIFGLAAMPALAAAVSLVLVPRTRVEANGVKVERSLEILPLSEWGFYVLNACGPRNGYTRRSFGFIAVSEERSW